MRPRNRPRAYCGPAPAAYHAAMTRITRYIAWKNALAVAPAAVVPIMVGARAVRQDAIPTPRKRARSRPQPARAQRGTP
jgi:hypothetical protein